MIRTKTVVTMLAAVVLAAAALLYASPYLALRSINQAIESRDAEALAQHVDFPVLRDNIKARLTQSMHARLPATQETDNPFRQIGRAIGDMMIGAAVDQLVSPTGIMLMMRNGQMPSDKPQKQAPAPQPGSTPDAQASEPPRGFALTHQGWNKVRVYRKSDPDTSFIFRREGLMGWKLIDLSTRGL